MIRTSRIAFFIILSALWCSQAFAQASGAPGFVEAKGTLFPQQTSNDETQAVADLLWRQEGVVNPAPWLRLTAGLDVRVNSHDQVEDEWEIDWEDRGLRASRLTLRRLAATVTAGPATFDLGKQLIRWARADVLNPMDRFAPRDFTNVIDAEFLPVTGVRTSVELGAENFEVVWIPQLTPSRMPLLDQRWTVLPPEAAGVSITDAGFRFPSRNQAGARWRHTGGRVEAGLSYVDGFNHLPEVEVLPLDASGTSVALTRVFPRIRSYGVEFALPMPWIALKGEGSYFTSPDDGFDEYGLYVLEIERQVGEWLLTAGYAGETGDSALGARGSNRIAFDPERGLARSLIGRVSYTVDPRRTIALETVVRQDGDGFYLKGEYSQGLAEHWRATFKQIIIAGEETDFIGQFDRNSHFLVALRFSY